MNRALPEMLHCLNGPGNGTDVTVLERQRARMKWQHQEQQGYFGGSEFGGLFLEPGQVGSFQGLVGGGDTVLGEVVTRSVKPDPGSENGWPQLVNMGFTEFEMNCAISRTSSCPPTVGPPVPEAKGKVPAPAEKMSSAVGRESFKKRKADKMQNAKVGECVCVCVFYCQDCNCVKLLRWRLSNYAKKQKKKPRLFFNAPILLLSLDSRDFAWVIRGT